MEHSNFFVFLSYSHGHNIKIKIKIRKYQENVKTSSNYSLVLSFLPNMKILLILAKNSWKIEIELFP